MILSYNFSISILRYRDAREILQTHKKSAFFSTLYS